MRSEIDFIQNIKKSFGLDRIGDDCAVLPKDERTDMLLTADLLVEDIDFRLEWTTPELLGHKTLAVSLSDIAAMGGEPKWAMLSVAVPEHLWRTDFLDRFYEGWSALAAVFDVELVGGDVSRSPERFVVDSIVCGQAAKGRAILRSGAKPGDAVFVSGALGGAAGGLRLLNDGVRFENAEDWQRELIERQLSPKPRIAVGKFLLESDLASAMIDLSDGLSSDLHQICFASGVGAELDAGSLPFDKNLDRITDTFHESLDLPLNGGEDFELLFTVPQDKVSSVENAGFFRVGTIIAKPGIVEIIDGEKVAALPPCGHRHF